MTRASRPAVALAALGAIGAVTVSWWALALWPVGQEAPEWLLRTREVCFGSTADRLPNAGGWLLLVGQPAGMLIVLLAVWGAELREGMAAAMARAAGQLALGIASAVLVAGAAGVVIRVSTAGAEAFDVRAGGSPTLTRVNDPAPALSLVDQSGRVVNMDDFHGRPVLVTFAFAHCATICPLIVSDVLEARRQLGDTELPAVIVTLDPWRDTPSRLPSIADGWRLDASAHVLSGAVDDVERVLSRWRVPRTRNQRTGDIVHPSIVYVVGPDGRINYVVTGDPGTIAAAVRAL